MDVFGSEQYLPEIDLDSHKYGDEFAFVVSNAFHMGQSLSEASNVSKDTKSDGEEIVTKLDEGLSEGIVESINEYFPEYGIIAEDAETKTDKDGKNFIVDPIDGTMNYSEGLPEYCVSIAVEDDNRTRAAAVYAPEHGNLYAALEGKGAFKNADPINVRDRQELEGVVYAKISDRSSTVRDIEVPVVKELKSTEALQVRRRGTAALDGCHIAEGAGIGQFLGAINDYDIAASNLIIDEAGGEILMREGQYERSESENYPEMFAANNQENLEELIEKREKHGRK